MPDTDRLRHTIGRIIEGRSTASHVDIPNLACSDEDSFAEAVAPASRSLRNANCVSVRCLRGVSKGWLEPFHSGEIRRFHMSRPGERRNYFTGANRTSSNAILEACACALLFLSIGALPAHAQAVIKVNDDVNFKFGVLGQFQADTISNPDSEPNTNNLFIRRMRLIFAGQVAKNVTFFVQTDAPNLGKVLPAGKNITPSVILQDAYASVKVADALTFDSGLIFVPGSRNNLTLTSTLLPIDYGPFTFSDITQEESTVGRDTGVQARGYLLGSRLEYRLGAFQGFRDPSSDNPFRYAGRVQYNLLDTETGYLYAGTYLGKKKVLAVGATFDRQRDFRAYDADVFFGRPLGPGAVIGQFDYNHFDGGRRLPTLLKQNDVLAEAGYLINTLKLTPFLQFARRDIDGGSAGDETFTSVGANYGWAGLNANVKAAYTRISPRGLPKQNEFTVQLQVFYF